MWFKHNMSIAQQLIPVYNTTVRKNKCSVALNVANATKAEYPLLSFNKKINLPKLISIHRYIIEEYDTYFFTFFKYLVPLKIPKYDKQYVT